MDKVDGILQIHTEQDGALTRVLAVGELDISSAPDLSARLDAEGSTASVMLDLTGVTFIDSTGLRVLLEGYRDLGDRLQIRPSAACDRLFDLAGVRDLLPLTESA